MIFMNVPVKIYTNQELLVTKTGRVEDEPGSRKVYQLILDSLQAKKKPGTTSGVGGRVTESEDPY